MATSGTTVAVLVGRDPAHRYSLHRGYVDMLWAVGAVPMVLTPPPRPADLDRYVTAVLEADALLVAGGGDVDPRCYGEEPAVPLMDLDEPRDLAELAAIRAASDSGRAVLGICRGAQALAVAFGGRLHQDLPTAGFAGHWEEDRQEEPVHGVTADFGSLALSMLGGAEVVNSIHHQAVRDPGPRLRATAWGADGVIEAIEGDGLLGLQWHPERMAHHDPRHLAPFRWLAAA